MRTSLIAACCLLVAAAWTCPVKADCPWDHVAIGQAEGRLIVDTSDVYRHWNADYTSNPQPYGREYYEFMPLFPAGYSRVEPGTASSLNPADALPGEQGVDYRIHLKREFATPGLELYDGVTPILESDGASYYLNDPQEEDPMHVHLRAFIPSNPTSIYVVKYSVWDGLDDGDRYLPSEPWLVFFGDHPQPGDANCDGVVDVGDLGILAGNWSSDQRVTWLEADFTDDGVVDVGDLGVLAGNWGAGGEVPEPGSLSLLLAGGVATVWARRRGRRP
jgi:hypothetical protein